MEIRWDAPRAFVLGFNTMLPALKAISLGYFSLGQQRKVTRAAAADRNARRVGGQIAESQQLKPQQTKRPAHVPMCRAFQTVLCKR